MRARIAAATASAGFDQFCTVDVRELATSIAMNTRSPCCLSEFVPVAPESKMAIRSVMLPFKCSVCEEMINIKTGKSCRINLDVDESASDAEEEFADEGRRKQKRRKQTNARPEYIILKVLGCLLAGQMFSEYETAAIAQGEEVMSHNTFDRYLGKLLPWIEAAAIGVGGRMALFDLVVGDASTLVASTKTREERARQRWEGGYSSASRYVNVYAVSAPRPIFDKVREGRVGNWLGH